MILNKVDLSGFGNEISVNSVATPQVKLNKHKKML